MSLAALLLGLPAKVFKLRGHNAPATPIVPPQYYSNYQYTNHSTTLGNFTSYASRWHPDVYSHGLLDQNGLNNSTIVSTEVCSLTGKGAIDGSWIKIYVFSQGIQSTPIYGLEIIVDGVNIVPSDWRLTQLMGANSCLVGGPIGRAGIHKNFSPSSGFGADEGHFTCCNSPIPFKESLVVNLVHYATAQTTTMKVSCYVNAWLTE